MTAPGAGPSAEPFYSDTTERTYYRLPEVYRRVDESRGYPLKRFLSAITDRLGEVEDLHDRIDYIDPADQVQTVRPPTTGENITVEAESMTAVGAGAWSYPVFSGATRARTNGPGPAYLESEVFVQGGTYQLDMRYLAAVSRGRVAVSLDGQQGVVFDTYSASGGGELLTTTLVGSVELARGYHTLRAEWTGTRNDTSTGTTVDLDYFRFLNLASSTEPTTSDLVDPNAADDAWLDWLAQLVGARLRPGLSRTERRDAVRYASGGFRAGTKAGIADAARSELTGTRYAAVYDHSTNLPGGVGTAGIWDVLIVTRASETPAGADIPAAIIRKGAKPAGVRLYHMTYSASWDTIEAQYPTWNAWENVAGSWTRIEEAGLA